MCYCDDIVSISSVSSEGSTGSCGHSGGGDGTSLQSSSTGGSSVSSDGSGEAGSDSDLLDMALRRIRCWSSASSCRDLKDALTFVEVSPGDAICCQGDGIRGMYIMLSSGPAAINENDGETVSFGSLIDVDGLVYNAVTSCATIRCCNDAAPCRLAFLSAEAYCHRAWLTFKHMYVITHSPLLRHSLQMEGVSFRFCSAGCGAELNMSGSICIIVDGVVKTCSRDGDLHYYPGHVVGAYERLSGADCLLQVEAQCSYAVIDDATAKHMLSDDDFTVAVVESMYQRSVVREARLKSTRTSILYRCESQGYVSVVPVVRSASVVCANGVIVSVNEFIVSGRLGKGATAQVFECQSPQYGKAALKVMDRCAGRESLHRELMALQALKNHQNIIALFTIIDDPTADITCLVEEMAERGSLVGVMMSSSVECQRVSCDIVRALMYMHSRGFIHRDVKPANIVRTVKGVSKLADFGCCVRMGDGGSGSAAHKQFMGTPAFMAPEMFIDGVVTPAVDVWSLASTLHYVVYGTLPFDTSVRGAGTRRGRAAHIEQAGIEDSIMYCEPILGVNARARHVENVERNWQSDDVTQFKHFCKMGLHKNPARRCTLGQWRQHEWLYYAV